MTHIAHVNKNAWQWNTEKLQHLRLKQESWAEFQQILNEDTGNVVLHHTSEEQVQKAAQYIKDGKLVALPTETVYGLAANSLNSQAVQNIYRVKGRPSDNPLIIHVSSLKMIQEFVGPIPPIYFNIIQKYWPGPLTLLFSLASSNSLLSPLISNLHQTVAVRFPSHPIFRRLIYLSGCPIAAPSANRSGRPSPTLAQHVLSDLKDHIPMLLDSQEQCQFGLESTVLNALIKPPVILRPGALSKNDLIKGDAQLKDIVMHSSAIPTSHQNVQFSQAPSTPGMKYTHYKPEATITRIEWPAENHLDQSLCQELMRKRLIRQVETYLEQYPNTSKIGLLLLTDFWCDFSNIDNILVISLTSNPMMIARDLFKTFRYLDEQNVSHIFMESLDEKQEEHVAVMNRIMKATTFTIQH